MTSSLLELLVAAKKKKVYLISCILYLIPPPYILYFLFLDMKYNYLINVCNKLLSVRSDTNINNNRKLLESAPLSLLSTAATQFLLE